METTQEFIARCNSLNDQDRIRESYKRMIQHLEELTPPGPEKWENREGWEAASRQHSSLLVDLKGKLEEIG